MRLPFQVFVQLWTSMMKCLCEFICMGAHTRKIVDSCTCVCMCVFVYPYGYIWKWAYEPFYGSGWIHPLFCVNKFSESGHMRKRNCMSTLRFWVHVQLWARKNGSILNYLLESTCTGCDLYACVSTLVIVSECLFGYEYVIVCSWTDVWA